MGKCMSLENFQYILCRGDVGMPGPHCRTWFCVAKTMRIPETKDTKMNKIVLRQTSGKCTQFIIENSSQVELEQGRLMSRLSVNEPELLKGEPFF